MPVALLEGCVTSSGCPTRTALSAPFHHLLSLVKAALQTHNPYSLQIPLDKVSSPITLPAAHMVSLGSSDKPNASVRQPRTLLPTTSAPLPFFWQSWEDSLTLHAQQFLLTSLSPPHYCCFPAWLPPSLNPSLPSAPLYVQLQLGSSLRGPSDSLSNDQMPSLSVISNVSSLSTTSPQILTRLIPLPEESLMRA